MNCFVVCFQVSMYRMRDGLYKARQLDKKIEKELREEYRNASFETLWCLYEKYACKQKTWDAHRFCVIRSMMVEKYPSMYYAMIDK